MRSSFLGFIVLACAGALVSLTPGCGSGSILRAADGGGDDDVVDADVDDIDAGGGPIDAGLPTADASPQTTRLRVTNRCDEPIWIAHSANVGDTQNVKLVDGAFHDYDVPASGLASARFWPKTGCDPAGQNCKIGDNGEGGGAPCGPAGCQPPIDSKFEVTFPPEGAQDATFYNLSLVDGYTLPFKVVPKGAGAEQGSCVTSDCAGLTLDACPGNENMSGGGEFAQYASIDLRVKDPTNAARTIGCLSPCKKWNYSLPYGLNQPENQDPGLHMCCPTPIDPGTGNCTEANGCIGPDACRATSDPMSVEHTSYVALIHTMCPSAYSYSYDDAMGLHACPADTAFEVIFCP